MKYIFFLICFLTLDQSLQAQSTIAATLDKDKLFDFYQSQRFAEAATYLKDIYPDSTRDVKALNQLAYCFMMAGQLPEAEKYYLKSLDSYPESLPVLFNLARIQMRRGNSATARDYLGRIINIDSANFNALKQMASLYTNDVDSSRIGYLLKANRLQPAEPDVAFDLASAQRKLKEYASAYAVLTTAITADTGNIVLQQARLPIAIQLKHYDEVIHIGEKLLNDIDDAGIKRDVAMAYYYLKNYKAAIRYFTALEGGPAQSESSLYYTALCYRALNDYKMASNYAQKTIQEGISDNISSYYLLLGGIYELQQQNNSALTAYKKGLSYADNTAIAYRLGILYDLTLKQKSNAILYYKRYLRGKPDIQLEKEQVDFVTERIKVLQPPKKR